MMTTQPEKVVFHGIDAWNRPCFRSLDRDACFFGSTEKLFSHTASIERVLAGVEAADLKYFGGFFDCEPLGTPAVVEIVRPTVDPDDLYRAREALYLARGAVATLEALPEAAQQHPEVVFSALEIAARSLRNAADLLRPVKANRS